MDTPIGTLVRRSISRIQGPRLLAHLAAAAGCAAALQPSAASATGRPVPPARDALDAAPPWSGSEGSPPPRPLARTRAATPATHPAVHPARERVAPPVPLFPRAADVLDRKDARRVAMERHPAGKGLSADHDLPRAVPSLEAEPAEVPVRETNGASVDRVCSRKHRVEAGETLWGIASRRSRSQRPVEILRLTMEIYRMNRRIIGPDPDLILPGQVLSLPERCER